MDSCYAVFPYRDLEDGMTIDGGIYMEVEGGISSESRCVGCAFQKRLGDELYCVLPIYCQARTGYVWRRRPEHVLVLE